MRNRNISKTKMAADIGISSDTFAKLSKKLPFPRWERTCGSPYSFLRMFKYGFEPFIINEELMLFIIEV